MRARRTAILGILVGLVGVPALARGGEVEPLVVAVEIEDGAATDPAQVRKAVGAELGRPVVAPGDAIARQGAQVGVPDLLLVVVNRARVVVSLRPGSDTAVSRALPAPGERGARLRAVAWLAGNLARDQATPLLLASGDGPAASAPPEPATPAPSPTEPPAVEAPPQPASAPAPAPALRVEGAAPPAAREGSWTLSVSGGFSLNLAMANSVTLQQGSVYVPTAYQAELVKHRPDGWVWGFGIDYPHDVGPGIGALALAGLERRWGRLGLELTAGLGLERSTVVTGTVRRDAATGEVLETSWSYTTDFVPYTRALVTGFVQLVPRLDLLVRAGAHEILSTDGTGATIVVTAVGLRYGFP